jgi:hypothetical protein
VIHSDLWLDHQAVGGSRDAWQLVGFHEQGDPAFFVSLLAVRRAVANLPEK